MIKHQSSFKSFLGRASAVIGAAALVAGLHNTANATQTVRELFDNLPNNLLASDGTTIDGMTNDFTSVGLSTGFWTNNPPGSTGIGYKGSWTMNWVLQGLQGNILPDSAGLNGLLNAYSGNLNSLIDPNTGNPYGIYSSQIYATHPLNPSAYVNCSVPGTYWFSVRIEKNYSWSAGDSSAGMGFSTGNGPTDQFIGIGVTRPGTTGPGGSPDWGDTDYVTQGTLGQAGIPGQDDTGGPYLPLATGPAQLYNSGLGAVSWAEAGLVVGRLVVNSGGNCELDVVTFLPNSPLLGFTTDPSLIVWDATTTFTTTQTFSQLLVWMHGPNVEYDAIRVGTSYADVIGLETVGAPVASPSNTVYAPTAVTFTQNAQVNSGNTPMSYQWFTNGVALDPNDNPTATNASLTLSSTVVGMTADYNLVVSNFFGMTTSAVTHLTVLPPTPVYFTAKPVSTTRYAGSPGASFSTAVNGTPPYTYQWIHAGTNYGPPVTTFAQSDTLVIPGPLTIANGGNYSVTVTNNYRTTNSGDVSLTIITPPAGSFAAAVTALSPWGYWRLDDNVTPGNPTLYDYWDWNNGTVVDVTTPTYQAPAAPYVGFPNPHQGITLNTGGPAACRVNLPKLPCWTNQMTLVFWVTNGAAQMCPMNGYGNGYGLYDNNGELIFEWASLGAPSGGGGMDTGLAVPQTGWTFVALVVEPTQATVYLGTNNSLLASATLTGLSLPTSDEAGDTAGLYAPGLGRMQWPWAEDGGGAPWTTMHGTWSDVAVFFYSLPPAAVTNLYLSGVGQWIYASADGLGNLNMNWNPAFTLQEASSVTGPWTDVGGSPTPPYSVPINTGIGQHYYRLRQ
ncbi:MAG TPA: hypothetical protein VMB80_07190 [Candidatus Acidoferrum sp.]|nr:hypothetical protein [Candidatus Acidoferrum sp.]